MFVTHRAKAAPAAKHTQAGNVLRTGMKALRPKATVAGLTIAAGATIFNELRCQGIDVPVPWSRFFRLAHKNGSAANTGATEKRDLLAPSHMTDCEGWQAPAWVYVLMSLSLAGFVAGMARRQNLESRRVSLLASRAVVAQPVNLSNSGECTEGADACANTETLIQKKTPKVPKLDLTALAPRGEGLPVEMPTISAAQAQESPLHTSRTSTSLWSRATSAWSILPTPPHSSRPSTSSLHFESADFLGFIHSESGGCAKGAAVLAITEALSQEKKTPHVPKLALEALAPWGEGLVSQRTSWFEETTGPAPTDEMLSSRSVRSRPTREEIDELYRLSSHCSTSRAVGPSHELDVLGQKRQESGKNGGGFEGDDGVPSMYSEYSTGGIFAA